MMTSLFWIPLLFFLAHMAEEFPRFPAWATRHFGATSRAWYVYSHIPLVILCAGIGWWAERSGMQGWIVVAGTGLMLTLALNGLFHLVTTFCSANIRRAW